MRLGLTILILWVMGHSGALADIEISPLRHVLDAETREATFSISNPSGRILEGRVGWIDLAATKNGYEDATPEQRQKLSAAPYLKVSPANFRLEPGGRIEVTVSLKDKYNPPPGELRSHLLIKTAAARTLMRKASDRGLQVDIGVGVSTPVIIRGKGSAEAAIGETKLLRDKEGLLLLATQIEPTGTLSTYGRVTVSFSSNTAGKHGAKLLGERSNVAGFTDTRNRLVEIPLGFFSLGAGSLTIRYEGMGEYAGRLFAEKTFEIAPAD